MVDLLSHYKPNQQHFRETLSQINTVNCKGTNNLNFKCMSRKHG